MTIAQAVIWTAAAYAAAGAVFAAAFITRGAGRIDPAARGAPIGFRLLIAPGAAALWPVLLAVWVRAPKEGKA